MNLQQQELFYQAMSRQRSRAASVPKDDKIITEVVDGLIVSKSANRIEHISTSPTNEPQPQAKVWNLTKDGPVLQQESKAASAPGINKLREIHNFIRSNGRF